MEDYVAATAASGDGAGRHELAARFARITAAMVDDMVA
jgi:hypothetical protein